MDVLVVVVLLFVDVLEEEPKMITNERIDYLYGVMRSAYDELIDFIIDTTFKDVIEDMYKRPESERPGYVTDKIMNPEYLRSRGIKVPKDILIQRSSFGDGRPTLFVVKKYLEENDRDIWENVNITFDQESDSGEDKPPDISWQKPLPPCVVSATQALGITAEQLQILRNK